jgi:hypothetical protein
MKSENMAEELVLNIADVTNGQSVAVTYRVDSGLRTILSIAVSQALEPRISDWQREIESGVISEELRDICIAMGWITQRDVRVHRIED